MFGACVLSIVLFTPQPSSEGATIRVRWLDLGGKGEDTDLTISAGWPLSYFATHRPWWDPALMVPSRLPDGHIGYRYGGPRPKDRLDWQPLEKLAPVTRLGTVGGIRVYQIAYSRTYQVVVWDRGGWSFVPAVIIAGDESIVVGVHTGRVFGFEGKDVLHVRIQFEGTGNFQQSLLFAAIEGRLALLEEPPAESEKVEQFLALHHLQRFHKGLGYCQDSLTEWQLFEGEVTEGYCRGCGFVIHHSIEGAKLVVRDIHLGDAKDKECEIFPRW